MKDKLQKYTVLKSTHDISQCVQISSLKTTNTPFVYKYSYCDVTICFFCGPFTWNTSGFNGKSSLKSQNVCSKVIFIQNNIYVENSRPFLLLVVFLWFRRRLVFLFILKFITFIMIYCHCKYLLRKNTLMFP